MTEIATKYRPTLEAADNMATGIHGQIGEQVQLIVNYKVIEKTKSYTVCKVLGVYALPSKRRF